MTISEQVEVEHVRENKFSVSNNEQEPVSNNSINIQEFVYPPSQQDTHDILSNTQLDDISNVADDLSSLEIPELGNISNANPIFTKVQQDETIQNPNNNQDESKSIKQTKRLSLISQWKKKKVSLCCAGKIGIVPCLSAIAILLSIFSLISIALLLILPFYNMKQIPIMDLMTSRAKLFASYIPTRDIIRLGVENKGNYDSYTSYYYYYYYKSNFNKTYMNFTQIIPSTFSHEFLTKRMETYPIFVDHWDKMVKKVVSFKVINGTTYYFLNKTVQAQARTQLYSIDYAQSFNEFQNLFYDMQDELYKMCNFADNLVKKSSIATLVLVCFSLAVILPTILIIFIFALRKDRSNEKCLHHTNRFLIKDTMSNESMRMDFKKFCLESKLEKQYFILERIQFYKEYSLESYDIQMKLFELTNEHVRNQRIDVVNDKNSLLIYKVAKEAEKKLIYFEKLKYETAFEIIEQCQDFYAISELIQEIQQVVDMYNNKKDIFEDTDMLPSKLLENIEKEVSAKLGCAHLQFKSTGGLNASKIMNCSRGGQEPVVANAEKSVVLLDQSVLSTEGDDEVSIQSIQE